MATNYDLQQTGEQVQQILNSAPEMEERTKDTTVININAMSDSEDTYTLETAIAVLGAYEEENNVTYRKSGLVLTYKTDTDTWESKQFLGEVDDFEDETLWDDFGSGGQPVGDYATRTELDEGLATKQPVGDYATRTELDEGLATKQGTISDLDAIRSGAGKGATSVQGVKMEGDDEPLSPDGNGVVTIPQPEIPDAVTSVLANNELVLQTPDGQSVKGKVGITTGADGLLHLTLTDEEGHTYSSPIAGLRVDGNALQYSNDGETWVTVQTFGKLAIKYVQASDPASGDEGDLALVGSTNAYVLKVYVGGSWVSVCDFGTLDLTSDGIIMAGENKTLTQKMAEVDGGYRTVNLSAVSVGDGLPHSHNGKWYVNDGVPRKHFYFTRIGYNKISVTAGSQEARIYFLKSYTTPETNTDVPLCDSPQSIYMVAANDTATFAIPADCQYVVILRQNDSTIYTPSSVRLINDASITSDEIDGEFGVDFQHAVTTKKWIGSNGEAVANANSLHYVFPLNELKTIRLVAGENGVYYTFATSVGTDNWSRTVVQRWSVEAGETRTVTNIPDGAKYLIIGKSPNGQDDFTPANVFFTGKKKEELENRLENRFVGIDTKFVEIDTKLSDVPTSVNTEVDMSELEELSGWVGGNGQRITTYQTAAHYSIPVERTRVTIVPNSNGSYYVWASAISGNTWTTLSGKTRESITSEQTIDIPDGAKYLIVGIRTGSPNDSEFTPESIIFNDSLANVVYRLDAEQQEEDTSSGDTFRVMTYNIGHLNGGYRADPYATQSTITDSDYDTKKAKGLAICEGLDTCFVGVAEYPLGFTDPNPASQNSHRGETTRKALFGSYWNSYIDLRTMVGEAENPELDHYDGMFGKMPLLETHRVEWKSAASILPDRLKNYYYMVATALFGKYVVKIVVVHLAFMPRDAVYNVTKNHPLQSGFYTLATALAAVPSAKKHVGLIITYQTDASTWEAKQFIGSDVSGWSTVTNWTDIDGESDDYEEMDWNTDTTFQDLQVAELIEAFAHDERVIIMGDFNAPSLTVFEPFVTAGYSLSNGGALGTFNTYRKTDAFANRALDNIIVKGFSIEDVNMVDDDLSDHNAFWADLKIIK